MKFFLIIGGALLVLAAYFFVREQSFVARAEQVTGTVSGYQTSLDTDNNTMYCAVIDFQAIGGQSGRYTAPCTIPAVYQIGEQVELMVDPQNPNDVKLRAGTDQHLASFITASIGLPFLLIGLYGWWADRRYEQRSRYVR